MVCDGSGSGPYICYGLIENCYRHQNGVVFRNLGENFELALDLPEDPGRILLGIVADIPFASFATTDITDTHGYFIMPCVDGLAVPIEHDDCPGLFNYEAAILEGQNFN